ncbi:hypothetical protein BDZ89DRAFT_1134586 [Hymenopellis radicata]|nr:hypothetical protein BDZ89DRAFT_1134586 [Hymenopellis radicata]
MDGTVTESELASVETQATTILITAFAILISAMVEAKTLGLNTFNANIVLDLSWMNNTNVFIYFILYIQHKNGREANDIEMKPIATASPGPRKGTVPQSEHTPLKAPTIRKEHLKTLFHHFVLLLGSIHLSVMSALGLWLWRYHDHYGCKRLSRLYHCACGVDL